MPNLGTAPPGAKGAAGRGSRARLLRRQVASPRRLPRRCQIRSATLLHRRSPASRLAKRPRARFTDRRYQNPCAETGRTFFLRATLGARCDGAHQVHLSPDPDPVPDPIQSCSDLNTDKCKESVIPALTVGALQSRFKSFGLTPDRSCFRRLGLLFFLASDCPLGFSAEKSGAVGLLVTGMQ